MVGCRMPIRMSHRQGLDLHRTVVISTKVGIQSTPDTLADLALDTRFHGDDGSGCWRDNDKT